MDLRPKKLTFLFLTLFFLGSPAIATQWVDSLLQTLASESCFRSLPSMAARTPEDKATELFYVLTNLRKIDPDSANEKYVSAAIIARFAESIRSGKPIKMYIPCFPAKSPNHAKKTLGSDPDLAEEIAVSRLSAVINAMNEIYPTDMVIASDGRVFGETWWSSDKDVDSYRKGLSAMIQSPQLTVHDLNFYFPGLTPAEAREKLLADYAPSIDEVRASFSDPKRLALYQAFARFIRDDTPPGDPALVGLSNKKIDQLYKDRAIDDMRRSDALNKFLAKKLVDEEGYIRLSIRDSTDTPEKLGINLLEGEGQEYTGSPWHNVIVVKKTGRYLVMKRAEAEEGGYRLVFKDGKPHHFEE